MKLSTAAVHRSDPLLNLRAAGITTAVDNAQRNKYPSGCGIGSTPTADGCGFQRCPTCSRNKNRDRWRRQ